MSLYLLKVLPEYIRFKFCPRYKVFRSCTNVHSHGPVMKKLPFVTAAKPKIVVIKTTITNNTVPRTKYNPHVNACFDFKLNCLKIKFIVRNNQFNLIIQRPETVQLVLQYTLEILMTCPEPCLHQHHLDWCRHHRCWDQKWHIHQCPHSWKRGLQWIQPEISISIERDFWLQHELQER